MFADVFTAELTSDTDQIEGVVGLLAGGCQFVGHRRAATDTDL
jgi:hypothetical protein